METRTVDQASMRGYTATEFLALHLGSGFYRGLKARDRVQFKNKSGAWVEALVTSIENATYRINGIDSIDINDGHEQITLTSYELNRIRPID